MPGNSNRNQFPRETPPFGLGLATGIFLGNFQPKLNGFTYIRQRFSVRYPLTMAPRQGGAGNRKTFLRFHHDHLILH